MTFKGSKGILGFGEFWESFDSLSPPRAKKNNKRTYTVIKLVQSILKYVIILVI